MPLFFDLEDAHRYLYHYTTREAALGSILPMGLIRFGLFRHTNDPRESKGWRFSLVQDDPDDDANAADDLLELSREATRIAKSTCKLLCLTTDDPVRSLEAPNEIFGRGFAHSRMWAQYGGGHSGVCLILERERLAADIQGTLGRKGDLLHRCVRYADRAPDEINAFALRSLKLHQLGLEKMVAEHVLAHNEPLFFRKNLDWASEFEYRWILRSPEPVPEFVPIRNSLVGICLGHDFPAGDRDALSYLTTTTYAELAVRQCRWDNGSLTLLGDDPDVVHIDARYWAAGSRWADGSPGPSLDEL